MNQIRLYIGEQNRELKPGDSWNIPSNKTHKADIIEDSVVIEVFNPVREDYFKFVNVKDVIE